MMMMSSCFGSIIRQQCILYNANVYFVITSELAEETFYRSGHISPQLLTTPFQHHFLHVQPRGKLVQTGAQVSLALKNNSLSVMFLDIFTLRMCTLYISACKMCVYVYFIYRPFAYHFLQKQEIR